MPSRETPAIILSVKDYGEADRLVTFLTPERGRLTGVAKHARKSQKRFAHCLEPLSRVVLFLSERPRRDMEFLEKGEAVRSFPALRRDLVRLGAGAILGALAAEMASPPEATAGVFSALEIALTLLDEGAPPESLLPGFLLHLIKLGGYGLSLNRCQACGQEPQPPIVVSLPQGGVLCGACAKGAPMARIASSITGSRGPRRVIVESALQGSRDRDLRLRRRRWRRRARQRLARQQLLPVCRVMDESGGDHRILHQVRRD